MSDIDYHSIYTQFITESCNGTRHPAVITKGFIGKLPVPSTKINVYQLIPSTVSERVLQTIELNRKHPSIQSYTAIKLKDTSIPQGVRSIDIPKGPISYSDVISVVDPNSVNIVLYDSVVIDQVWTDYIGHISSGMLGILSSRKFTDGIPEDVSVYNDRSAYTYEIDNFNGFIFLGRPQIDLNYFVNVFGSKHMLIKKFYQMKFNIVNLANIVPCYMFEQNPDYKKAESYLNAPSFSIMIVQPQSDTVVSDIVIDEKEIFRERDSTPVDPPVCFPDLQLNVDNFIPILSRLNLSELEHNIRVTFYNQHRTEYEQMHKHIVENQIRLQKDFDARIQDARVAQMTKLEEDYKNKTKELLNRYTAMEQQLASDLDSIREQKMKEIDDKVEAELDIARGKRSIELETEKKTLFDALEAQYSVAQRERQKAVADYEKSERERVEREITDIYSTKYDQLNAKLDAHRREVEANTEKLRAKLETKIAEEIRTEYISKYNEEYIKSLAQLVKSIEQRKTSAFVTLDKEIQAIRNSRKKEIERWEGLQMKTVSKSLVDYEAEQRAKIMDITRLFYDSQMIGVQTRINNKYTEELHRKLNTLDQEIQTIRLQKLQELNEESTKLFNIELEKINRESSIKRTENEKELLIEYENEKAKLVRELENFELKERAEIKERLIEHEKSESDAIMKERESVIQKIIDSKRAQKEAELNSILSERMMKDSAAITRNKNELEQQFIQKRNELTAKYDILLEEEDARLKKYETDFANKLQIQEEKIREQILSTRLLYIESECAKIREQRTAETIADCNAQVAAFTKKMDENKDRIKKEHDDAIELLKQTKMAELDEWAVRQKEEKNTILQKELAKLEDLLKEQYELKKFEYAEVFTKEMVEIEKSRIGFHSREQARLMQELVDMKDAAVTAINTEVESLKQSLLKSIVVDVDEHRKQKIKEIEEQVVSQTDTIFHDKLREIEASLEEKALANVNIMMEKRKQEIESELQTEKTKMLEQTESEVQAIRIAALSELEQSFETLKADRNEKLRKMDIEFEEIRSRKSEEIDSEMRMLKQKRLEELQKKAEEEHAENERKRKAKIREMEQMVMKLHA
jgi:hypothetical protein